MAAKQKRFILILNEIAIKLNYFRTPTTEICSCSKYNLIESKFCWKKMCFKNSKYLVVSKILPKVFPREFNEKPRKQKVLFYQEYNWKNMF